MENKVKNWKFFENGVNVSDAIKAIKCNTYKDRVGAYAIKSVVTGRFVTEFNSSNEKFTIPEIEGEWIILVPDDEKETMTKEVAYLIKNSNWSGMTHKKIDNLSLAQLWESVSEKIMYDEKLMYKAMKMFFENKLYMK